MLEFPVMVHDKFSVCIVQRNGLGIAISTLATLRCLARECGCFVRNLPVVHGEEKSSRLATKQGEFQQQEAEEGRGLDQMLVA